MFSRPILLTHKSKVFFGKGLEGKTYCLQNEKVLISSYLSFGHNVLISPFPLRVNGQNVLISPFPLGVIKSQYCLVKGKTIMNTKLLLSVNFHCIGKGSGAHS